MQPRHGDERVQHPCRGAVLAHSLEARCPGRVSRSGMTGRRACRPAG